MSLEMLFSMSSLNCIRSFRSGWRSATVLSAGAALTVLLSQADALAQQAMPEATGATTRFPIKGFQLTGDNPLSESEVARVLSPFIRPDATLDTLQKATAALETELKAKGFALLRVSLPPQDVGDKVSLHLVKFVMGKVSVQGQSHYSEANIRASVPELREGQAPNFRVLSVQTAIANENPGKQLQVSLKESLEADKIDARLLVTESKPLQFSATLTNAGSESTGRDRFSLMASHANLFDLDHQLSLAYTTSLQRIKDVKQFGLIYRVPLYRQGGVLGLTLTKSDVLGNFGTFSNTGAGQTLGLSYNHFLEPDGGLRAQLTFGLDEKLFEASLVNGEPVPGQMERGSRPLTLGYTVRVESDSAVWGYNAELALNLPGSRGNDVLSYQSEDVRLSSVNWKVLRAGANYMAPFASRWMWSVRGQFQYSADALISGEQFGLGGALSVRGTGERAVSGDSGLFGSLEITAPEFMPGLRALGFLDAGWLRNNNSDANPNKPASDHLISVGFGLRYAAGAYGLSLDWARLLSGSVLPTSASTTMPQTGDQKIHFNLTANF